MSSESLFDIWKRTDLKLGLDCLCELECFFITGARLLRLAQLEKNVTQGKLRLYRLGREGDRCRSFLQRLLELFFVSEVPGLLHFADCCRQRHVKPTVKHEYSVIDYGRWFQQLELTVRIE